MNWIFKLLDNANRRKYFKSLIQDKELQQYDILVHVIGHDYRDTAFFKYIVETVDQLEAEKKVLQSRLNELL